MGRRVRELKCQSKLNSLFSSWIICSVPVYDRFLGTVTIHYFVVVKRCSALFFSDVVMVKKVHHLFPKNMQVLIRGDVSHSLAALSYAVTTRIDRVHGRGGGRLSLIRSQGKKACKTNEEAGHCTWNAVMPALAVGNVFSLKAAAPRYTWLRVWTSTQTYS